MSSPTITATRHMLHGKARGRQARNSISACPGSIGSDSSSLLMGNSLRVERILAERSAMGSD